MPSLLYFLNNSDGYFKPIESVGFRHRARWNLRERNTSILACNFTGDELQTLSTETLLAVKGCR